MLLNQMNPRIQGKAGSSRSEGSNKCFSFKRIIPNLKMIRRMIRKSPVRTSTGQSQGEAMQRVMTKGYSCKRLRISMPSRNLDPLLY